MPDNLSTPLIFLLYILIVDFDFNLAIKYINVYNQFVVYKIGNYHTISNHIFGEDIYEKKF